MKKENSLKKFGRKKLQNMRAPAIAVVIILSIFFPMVKSAPTAVPDSQNKELLDHLEKDNPSSSNCNFSIEKGGYELIKGYYVDEPDQISTFGDYTRNLSKMNLGVEIIEKRTPTARHFINKDGTITAILSVKPTSFKDEKGLWNDIDSTNVKTITKSNTKGSDYLGENYYGFAVEYDNDGFSPFTRVFKTSIDGNNYLCGVGWDDGFSVWDNYYRSYVQWDTSSIPDDADITDVDVQFYTDSTTNDPFGDDVWTYHDVYLKIYDMDYKPSDYFTSSGGSADGNWDTLFNDCADGTCYCTPGWTSAGDGYSVYYDLGSSADATLENQLSSNWFAIGFTDYYEQTYDEGICLVLGWSTLAVTYKTPQIDLSPSSHNFGTVPVGSCSSEYSFTLTNTGGGTATGNVYLTGGDSSQFTITQGGGSFSLSAGQSKTIKVKFCPTSSGSKSTTLKADGSNCNDDTASLYGTGESTPQIEWTIMVYMDGDNNLEGAGIADINEMEEVGSTNDINIVVQFDRTPGWDSTNGDWNTTRRYYIEQDTDTSTISSTLISDLGELNMGDPNTLSNFVIWAIQNYPADHYALIIWDHGSGWKSEDINFAKSCCEDETDGDELTITELRTASIQRIYKLVKNWI